MASLFTERTLVDFIVSCTYRFFQTCRIFLSNLGPFVLPPGITIATEANRIPNRIDFLPLEPLKIHERGIPAFTEISVRVSHDKVFTAIFAGAFFKALSMHSITRPNPDFGVISYQ
jgi:hypothetical protein